MRRTMVARVILAAMGALTAARMPVRAAEAADSTFRVFLTTGVALPSYGEPVQVGDRMVFNLLVRADGAEPILQLMSLPLSAIDVPRTAAYANALHAAFYARTRGELDYQALLADTARVLDGLAAVDDPARRIEMAEAGRDRVLAWPKAHEHYREADVIALADLFDDAIADVRAKQGESTFSFDLVARTPGPNLGVILPAPDTRETAAFALAAAAVEDRADERAAILASVASAVSNDPSLDDLAYIARARLGDEARVDRAYATLAATIHGRMDAAVRHGDVAAVAGLETDLATADRALGSARPDAVVTLASEIEAALGTTRVYRAKLDHYAAVHRRLLAYDRAVRPAFTALARTERVLKAIRDMRSVSLDELAKSATRLRRLQTRLGGVVPPDDFAGVHATLISTVQMAREACDRRRLAVVTGAPATSRDASAAASGSLLLAARAHDDLSAGLHPPGGP